MSNFYGTLPCISSSDTPTLINENQMKSRNSSFFRTKILIMKKLLYLFFICWSPFLLEAQFANCSDDDQQTIINQWDWNEVVTPQPTYGNNPLFADGLLKTNIHYDPDGITNCNGILHFVVDPTDNQTLPCGDCDSPEDGYSVHNYRSEIKTEPTIKDQFYLPGSEHWIGWTYYFGENIADQLDRTYTIFQNRRTCNIDEDNDPGSPGIEIVIAGDEDSNSGLNSNEGELLIYNRFNRNINGKAWPTGFNVKSLGSSGLNVVVHVILGGEDENMNGIQEEGEGILQVWFNGILVHSEVGRSVCPANGSGQVSGAGNYHWGIYAHNWNSAEWDEDPFDDPEFEHTDLSVIKELFMDKLTMVLHCPAEENTYNHQDFIHAMGASSGIAGCDPDMPVIGDPSLSKTITAESFAREDDFSPNELDFGDNKFVGIRFTDLPPRLDGEGGALVIDRAYIQFTSENGSDDDCFELRIRPECNGQAPPFDTGNDSPEDRICNAGIFDEDFLNLYWGLDDWGWCMEDQAGAAQRTPDLKEMLQGIIDEPSFNYPATMNPSPSVVFIFKQSDGSGDRVAQIKDSNDDGTDPVLFLEYHYDPCFEYTIGFSSELVFNDITDMEEMKFTPNISGPPADCMIKTIWDFGDGKASFEEEPIHDYAFCREYQVCLTVEIEGDNCTNCTQEVCEKVVFEENACPTPCEVSLLDDDDNLSFEPIEFSKNRRIFYIDYNSLDCPIASVEWDYGDGSPACYWNRQVGTPIFGCGFLGSKEWVLHEFAECGDFNVCVTVVDECGCEHTFCSIVTIIYEDNENLVEIIPISCPSIGNIISLNCRNCFSVRTRVRSMSCLNWTVDLTPNNTSIPPSQLFFQNQNSIEFAAPNGTANVCVEICNGETGCIIEECHEKIINCRPIKHIASVGANPIGSPWRIYPNPARNKIHTDNPGSIIRSARIMNTSGQVERIVPSHELLANEINIVNLINGTHFILFDLVDEAPVIKQFVKMD